MIIECPVSLGEIIDKITILEIKEEKIDDKQKTEHARKERQLLEKRVMELNLSDLDGLKSQLKLINLKLWQIEDDIRDCEAVQKFDNQFVDLARSVYKTNDQRFLIKKQINERFGSQIQEVKSYKNY